MPMYASSRPQLESCAAERAVRRVDAGDQALRRCFFVPDVPLICPARNSPATPLRLEPPRQLGRLNEVVFDGVAGPQQHGVLEPRQRVHEIRLNVARQAHREAVDVDLARVHAFRLEKNLVPLLVREADDLVFERRAIPRTDAANLPVEQRRPVDVRAHEIAHAIVRVQQIAVDLRSRRSRR